MTDLSELAGRAAPGQQTSATVAPLVDGLILTPLHSLEPGGVERVARRLAQEWHHAGENVLLTLGRPAGLDEVGGDVAPHRLLGRWGERWRAYETFWMLFTLPWTLLRRRPAILFCAGNTYTVVAAFMKLFLGRWCPPIVVKISNDLTRPDLSPRARWWYDVWLRLQGRMLDHFVGLAEPMRGELERELHVPPTRVSIVPDPILTHEEFNELAALQPASVAEGRHFVAIGRLVDQKNYALLIDAFHRLNDERARLTIYGDGPERDALARQIETMKLTGRVRLAGHVDSHRTMLRDAHALVMSSRYEGLPAVVIEALAAGRPVITTDCCVSLRAIVGQAGIGLVVPQHAEALASALEGFDPAAFSPRRARQVAAEFALEVGAHRYLNLFAAMLAARHNRTAGVRPLAVSVR